MPPRFCAETIATAGESGPAGALDRRFDLGTGRLPARTDGVAESMYTTGAPVSPAALAGPAIAAQEVRSKTLLHEKVSPQYAYVRPEATP